MADTSGPRLPFETLDHTAWILSGRPRWSRTSQSMDRDLFYTTGYLAEQLGVSIRCVARWKVAGLTVKTADRAATALGLHPCHIWGDAWWALVPEEATAC